MTEKTRNPQESEISLEDKRRLLDGLIKARKRQGWNREVAAREIKISRKTLGRFLNSTSGKFSANVVSRVTNYLKANPPKGGFSGRDMYLSIASGMDAETKNNKFVEQYSGDYCVLRAHVPSTRPLMSRLQINPDRDSDGTVVRYKHEHVVSDSLSLLRAQGQPKNEVSKAAEAIVYEGFVFVCKNRAFFLSTANDTHHVKEMIVNLRRGESASQVTMRGLLLTLSADDREPFASRILLQKMDEKTLKKKEWCPGLKDSWERFKPFPEITQVFSEKENFGLLRMQV